MKLILAFLTGLFVSLSFTLAAAPTSPLLREVNLLWRYVESGPDNPDIPALNKALDLRDRRLRGG